MTLLNHRYTILEAIAEGANSVVYLAEDTQSHTKVVIKKSKHSLQLSEQQSWNKEIQLLQQLHFPKVVKIIDNFIARVELVSYGYIVQEYIEGCTLAEEFTQKRYTQAEIVQIGVDILEILEHLQELSPPIIHRDIKPANLMRRKRDSAILLLDFGIAIDHQQNEYGATMGVGTIGYQAPEQIHGFPTLSSDVYSTAVLMVEFLSRRSANSLLQGTQIHWKPYVTHVSADLQQWLEKALSDVEQRFATATQALEALQKIATPRKTERTQIPSAPTPPSKPKEHQTTSSITTISTRSSSTPQHTLQEIDRRIAECEQERNTMQLYMFYSMFTFFCLSFFCAIPIHYFWKKKQRIEQELQQLQLRKQQILLQITD